MTHKTRRQVITGLAGQILGGVTLSALASPRAALARVRRYRLIQAQSQVGFAFDLQGARQHGTMPVQSADIRIDPRALQGTKVTVALNVAQARTGFFLATQALTGPDVLAAARYPLIHFRSTRIRLAPSGRLSDGATVTGDLTVRDITRPVTLAAALYRSDGSAPEDLDRLNIRLQGAISRAAFGATGYRDLVADQVQIDIRALIHVTE